MCAMKRLIHHYMAPTTDTDASNALRGLVCPRITQSRITRLIRLWRHVQGRGGIIVPDDAALIDPELRGEYWWCGRKLRRDLDALSRAGLVIHTEGIRHL